jgi:hypothetical protein
MKTASSYLVYTSMILTLVGSAPALAQDDATLRAPQMPSANAPSVSSSHSDSVSPSAATSKPLAHRFSSGSKQTVQASCPTGATIEKASCEARLAGAGLSPERLSQANINTDNTAIPFGNHDEGMRTIATKTEVVESGLRAECHAVGLHPDDVVRLTMSYHCAGETDARVSQN